MTGDMESLIASHKQASLEGRFKGHTGVVGGGGKRDTRRNQRRGLVNDRN